jgi:predicted RNase H-like HicB family nuclease
MADKSFVVIDGDLRLLVTPGTGWYVVSSLDIRGLNTQGKTIEEAIANAHDAAKVLAEDRAAIMKEIAVARKKMQSGKGGGSPVGRARRALVKV